MRKALIFLALLLILSVGGTVYLSEAVYATRDDVSVSVHPYYGDISALEGAEVMLHAQYDRRLFWDVSYEFGDETTTASTTEYYYTPTREYETGSGTFGGVYLNPDSYYQMNYSEEAAASLTGWEKMSYEAAKATPNGTEMSHTFRLADYMDYYLWSIGVDLPHPIGYTSPADTDWLMPAEQETINTIWKFFKIPVLENEFAEISVGKDDEGRVYSMGSGSGMNPAPLANVNSEDWYNGYVHNAVTEDTCYFIIHGLSSRGVPIDFSEVPGGYGIYRLPYTEPTYDESGVMTHTGIYAEELEMVYPLRQDMEIAYFAPSSDGSRLILCTIEDGEYIFTAIDAHTMETLQRFTLSTMPTDGWVGMHVEEDFLVCCINAADGSETLTLLTRDENGDYHAEFTVDAGLEHDPTSYMESDTVMAYNGEKLLSVSLIFDDNHYGTDTCNFVARVYDETGLLYCGEYRTSLSNLNDYVDYNYPVYPMHFEPLEISW